MTDNNQDIDIFFREMEQVSEPEMQHYQANWNAMQDMLAGKTILPRNQRWNPGMLNSLFSMMVGGCVVAGLIFVFSKKQEPKTTDPVNLPAAKINPMLTQDSVGDTLQNNSTFYRQSRTDSGKIANTQTMIANTQPKIANTQTTVANTQTKFANTQTKTANTLMKAADTEVKAANTEMIDQSMQTFQSDTLIAGESETVPARKPQTEIKVHRKNPSLESVSTVDSSFEINQKSSLKKPVSFSFDTVVIPFKITSLKPTKKSRTVGRVYTTTQKQKHLPDQTIHH